MNYPVTKKHKRLKITLWTFAVLVVVFVWLLAFELFTLHDIYVLWLSMAQAIRNFIHSLTGF